MEKFKASWDIDENWQLLFPFLGLVVLAYTSYKIANKFLLSDSIVLMIAISIICFLFLLKATLFLFKKLESKWHLKRRWEMIRVFIVFAITGSSSLFIGRPLMFYIGITKENLNPIAYWALFIIIGLIFYQILLVTFGWLFGQFEFFWEFEKKMLKRLGLNRFID